MFQYDQMFVMNFLLHRMFQYDQMFVMNFSLHRMFQSDQMFVMNFSLHRMFQNDQMFVISLYSTRDLLNLLTTGVATYLAGIINTKQIDKNKCVRIYIEYNPYFLCVIDLFISSWRYRHNAVFLCIKLCIFLEKQL